MLSLKQILLSIVSFGYVGLISNKCPGTLGSLAALFISFVLTPSLLPLCFCLSFVVGTFAAHWFVQAYSEDKDPGYVVIDEVAAIFLCNSTTLYTTDQTYFPWLLNFIFFRIFDIWKPFGIRAIDLFCKAHKPLWGLGIMLDDLLAAIPTIALSSLVCRIRL